MAAVRRDGYALNREEGEEGICAVGVALRDRTGAPLAAVAVVVPAGRMPTKAAGRALVPALFDAAERILQLL